MKRRRKGSSNFGRKVRRGQFAYIKMQKNKQLQKQSGDKEIISCHMANSVDHVNKKKSLSPPQLIQQSNKANMSASQGVIQTRNDKQTKQPANRNETEKLANDLDEMIIEEENAILFNTYHNQDPTMKTAIAYVYRRVMNAPPPTEWDGVDGRINCYTKTFEYRQSKKENYQVSVRAM